MRDVRTASNQWQGRQQAPALQEMRSGQSRSTEELAASPEGITEGIDTIIYNKKTAPCRRRAVSAHEKE